MFFISDFEEINLSRSEPTGARTLGFIGIEKQDIINFLSRIICNLGNKVLIIDNGHEHILPNIKLSKTEYRKVDFMKSGKISDVGKDYDYILLNFTFNRNNIQDLYKCSDIFIVSDLQNQNNICISEFFMKNLDISKLSGCKKSIILRDVIKCKIKPKYILKELKAAIGEYENSYILNYDDINYKHKVMCQYDAIFKFNGLSVQLEDMLSDILINIGFTKKDVKKAYRLAKRGE